MENRVVDQILNCMAIFGDDPTIQRAQTEHRLKLADFWGISVGSKVLEIGCGQGDTTAVLSYLVGEQGLVYGIDIASSDYGAPITLGEAQDYLKKSKLGKQINIAFETDILSSHLDFPEDFFDYIVLSHCSWYFKSFQELSAVFEKIKKWGKKLCYAEWDTRIQKIEQQSHFLAVLVQAQYECFNENSEANVRTLFTPKDVNMIAEKVGWTIISDQSIYSPKLQDGEWEVNYTLSEYKGHNGVNDIPEKLKLLVESEMFLLEESLSNHEVKPMSTYAFIARR